MFYCLYRITNTVNDKIYIGVHRTYDLEDDYMGSGTALIAAIKKYGIENFTKEILEVFDNAEDMFAKEREVVTEEFVSRKDVYNIRVGGEGGDGFSEEGMNKLRQIGKTAREQKSGIFSLTPEQKKASSLKGRTKVLEKYPQGTFAGRRHTEEVKNKIRESALGKHDGEKNSQYGTRWIYSLELKKSMKIPKTDSLPVGWHEGRKMSFE
jgi:group I intron endonuclease